MKVSIIIPAYNCADYLKKSIETVLQQTYVNKEIIIVDDSSTDDSYAIAKGFENQGVIIIQQPNAGAAVARNKGLAYASGEYIQFLDADDFLSPDKIERQVAALAGDTSRVAVCNYVSFIEDKEIKETMIYPDQSSFIYSSDNPINFLINLWGGNGPSNFIQTNCWLVPRNIINKAGYWRKYRCPDDDGEFFSRVLLASAGIVYVTGIMNFYRRQKNEHKLSSNPNRKYVQNTLLSIDLKYKYLKQKSDSEKIDSAFAKQYLDFAIYNYPQYAVLSEIALRRFKKMNQKATVPLLGGKLIESIKNLFGWKAARFIKFYLK